MADLGGFVEVMRDEYGRRNTRALKNTGGDDSRFSGGHDGDITHRLSHSSHIILKSQMYSSIHKKKVAEKFVHFKDRTVILRPSITHREPKDNHFARIEKIIVDLYMEVKKMDSSIKRNSRGSALSTEVALDQLKLSNGKGLLIGSQRPEELAQAIKAGMRGQRRRKA